MKNDKSLHIESTDHELINESLAGNKYALETLVKKHQTWVFNVALNLTANASEAADLMQEVLIKMVTHLGKFEQKSAFRTWVYRIIKNHFLNTQKAKDKAQIISWEAFGHGLDTIPDEELSGSFELDKELIIEEAKLSCMKAMLLCLTPEQRLVYVMGELFEIPDSIAGEVLEISKANFRKKLSRARQQLYSFMNQKCGLINKANPCRCARKTAGFIRKGYVDPRNLQFQKNVIARIEDVANHKTNTFETEGMKAYRDLFRKHNYQEPQDQIHSLKKLLSSETVRNTFEWQ